MIIDIHGHVTAPDKLYVYKSNILSHRGGHGRGEVGATDQDIHDALSAPVFGGTSHLSQLKEVGTDMQIISPRPYQMMHSEQPKVVQWYMEETNKIIARQCKLYPQTFRGVAGLPQFHVGHAGDFRASPQEGKGAIIDPRVLAASYA